MENNRFVTSFYIKKFGPVKEFKFTIEDFNVLTGPQASGKSTIAKVVFFCLTLKNEILSQLTMPKGEEVYDVTIQKGMEKRLRGKFLRMFGSTWAMPMDMEIICEYRDNVSLRVFLEKDRNDENKNFVEFEFSGLLLDFIKKLDETQYVENEKYISVQKEINEFFADSRECIYVPAGRGMISLLTDQLNYFFSSANDMIPLTIDYCTRAYVELILRLRVKLNDGLKGLLDEKLRYTQDIVDKSAVHMMMEIADKVQKGRYYYSSGEERLSIDGKRFVKINYASSGQQESIWIFNLMFYFLLNNRRTIFILEEPEAHLYPEAQCNLARAFGLFSNKGNSVLLTTHSPYILGALNTMLYAAKVPQNRFGEQSIIHKDCVLVPQNTGAYFINNGDTVNAMSDGLIRNELIDGAAEIINKENDVLLDIIFSEVDREDS